MSRQYFIDWLSFSVKLGTEASDHTIYKRETGKIHLVRNSLVSGHRLSEQIKKFEDGLNTLIKYHSIHLLGTGLKGINYIKKGLFYNFDLRGSFFRGDLIDNIHNIKSFYYDLKQQHHNWSLLRLTSYSIYRLDMAYNLHNYTFNMPGHYYMERKQPRRSYHDNLHNPDQLTGISIGKRGKNYCHFRIYDKSIQTLKDRHHDQIRFGTTNFLRLEYEIGKLYLKKLNLNRFENIGNLTKLTLLCKLCEKRKGYYFIHERFKQPKVPHKYVESPDLDISWNGHSKQIAGIINHENFSYSDVVNSLSELEKWLLKNDIEEEVKRNKIDLADCQKIKETIQSSFNFMNNHKDKN